MSSFSAGLAAAIVVAAASPVAAEDRTRRADVRLVAETTGVRSSGAIWLGLHVTLREGWHTYWVNPGDSGAPARIDWTLPEGTVAGDVVWPAPHRMSNPPFADFGYEDEVLLLVPLTTSNLRAGSSLSLTADVRLLVCREACVPERSTVTLELPVHPSPAAVPDTEPLFASARRRVPGPPPPTWQLQARARDGRVELAIDTPWPPRAVEFFPLRPLELQHAAPQPYRPLARGATLTLQVDERLREPPARLTGVLVVEGASAITIDVPVATEPPR